eukprot:scaffold8026_cov444-Prasinococcus_capsulatus_cf.AAC.2
MAARAEPSGGCFGQAIILGTLLLGAFCLGIFLALAGKELLFLQHMGDQSTEKLYAVIDAGFSTATEQKENPSWHGVESILVDDTSTMEQEALNTAEISTLLSPSSKVENTDRYHASTVRSRSSMDTRSVTLSGTTFNVCNNNEVFVTFASSSMHAFLRAWVARVRDALNIPCVLIGAIDASTVALCQELKVIPEITGLGVHGLSPRKGLSLVHAL